VFSDALNHASLVDGARLAARAGAAVHVYRHCDAGHLGALLAASPARRKLILTDSLFSMDGDFAPLAALAALRAAHGAFLLVDDAHATLVCGRGGEGGAAGAGVAPGDVDAHVGTLSKAVGAQGGFVACSGALKALLVTTARGQVYSTALPLPTVASASAALAAARAEPWRRAAVWARVRQLAARTGLRCDSPIVAIHVGGEAEALAASAALLSLGFHVPAIRPPTVPAGTCRLRVALSAAHTAADVDALADALARVGVLRGAAAHQAEAAAAAAASGGAGGGAAVSDGAGMFAAHASRL
jgi:8-amino-7-oxononanoate synthase